MNDDADRVSLEVLEDATRKMRGHLRSLAVWMEQAESVLHSMRHELTKLVIAVGLMEMVERDQEATETETKTT